MTDSIVEYQGRTVHFLNLDPTDHIEGYLARGEWYEDRVLRFIEDLQVEGNYLDVGAYVGNHTIFFSLFCPSEIVYSCEPQFGIFTDLLQNIRANKVEKKCVPMRVALSECAGLGIFESTTPHNRGMATCQPERDYFHSAIITTLDSLNLDIKLMKLDIEGMELKALRGAEQTLKLVEHLFVEMPRDGFDNLAITHLLINNDFEEREHFEEEQLYYFRKKQ